MAKATIQKKPDDNAFGFNFEAQHWAASDKMRSHMDACRPHHAHLL